ncbi:PP-loop family protein, partial [Neisseria elongata subsp. glycolytica ATCC 29315]
MHDLNDFPAQALPDGLSHARHIEAALSGGLDSVVLLHLLSRLAGRLNIKLTAVHVHHGLQDEADGWLEFCRDYCARLAVPLRWQKLMSFQTASVSKRRHGGRVTACSAKPKPTYSPPPIMPTIKWNLYACRPARRRP